MDHEQAGHGVENPRQALLDECLGVDVERRQRVVEYEHRRAGEDGPRQGQPLPLPS